MTHVKLYQNIIYDGVEREAGEIIQVDERDAVTLCKIKKAIRTQPIPVRRKRKDMRAGRNYRTKAHA